MTVLAAVPNVLVINPKSPFSTIADMVAFAKANPDKLSYASPGVGSSSHLAMEWLKSRAGIRMTHVPYNGLGPAMNDVIAGHVNAIISNTFSVLALIKDGKLRPLGVDSEQRVAELPDVPAISESFSGYVVTTWFAVVAPPKTSDDIAAKVSIRGRRDAPDARRRQATARSLRHAGRQLAD